MGTPITTETPLEGLKLDTPGNEIVLNVDSAHTASWQMVLTAESYGSAVVTLERSLDGVEYFAMDAAETLSADGMGNLHDVRGSSWIRAVVTTVGTANARARVTLKAWSE